MTLSSRSRLLILIATMLGLAILVVWAATTSWVKLRDVRRHFEDSQRESLQYDAERLRALIINTTAALFTFEVSDRDEDRQALVERRHELDAWLQATQVALRTDRERATFKEITTAYAAYISETNALADANPINEPKELMIARFGQIQRASERLLTLSTELANIRRQNLGESFRKSERSVVILQPVIFGSLLLLALLTAWSARVVYRETIAPLKLKLIETHAIAERQEKLASLGVLAAGVAHEIRNPLTAIKARLFTQKKELTEGTPAYNDGEFIAREIIRLERIVRDFLSFARPSASRRESISPAALLNQVQELLAPQLQERAVELLVEAGPKVLIEGDAQQLQQVLINLAQNAADSIEDQGRITLRYRTDKLALSE
ncbi:MAG: hypothetical protein M3Y03_00145, partial [Verrucomicrobiota bacterium]|nr:hypothetical protein [Verrucomicrobiota bacterium]